MASLQGRYAFRLVMVMMAAWLLVAAAAIAEDSQIVTPGNGYAATDFLPDEWIDAFCMFGDDVVTFSNTEGLEIIDHDHPAVRQSLGKPDAYLGSGAVWCSFVAPDPSGESFWVGFTISNNSDDRIYEVGTGGVWTHRATLTGNFDLEFFGSDAYVSANPGAVQLPRLPENTIYQLDTTGGNDHDALAEVGGYSTGLGLDTSGNLYCATYYLDYDGDGLGPDDNRLFRFTAAQIASAVGPGNLTLVDAEELFAMSSGSSDVDVDDAGHVVFSDNDASGGSAVVYWNEALGGEIVQVATPPETGSPWFTSMDVVGDVTVAGGQVCVVDYWSSGIAEVVKLIPGDADGDGTVDQQDLLILAANWGEQTDVYWAEGDFDGDGMVGPADAALLAAHWGQSLSLSEGMFVPEPGAAVLVLGMLGALVAVRRRLGCHPGAPGRSNVGKHAHASVSMPPAGSVSRRLSPPARARRGSASTGGRPTP